jgi:hypothetical protein
MARSRAVSRVGIFCLVFSALAVVRATPSGATIIRYDDGSDTTIKVPADDPGWANVGKLYGSLATASGVYLGNGWVLTAAHVGGGTVDFAGQPYDMKPGSWHRLHHPSLPGWEVDLGLFQLTETPQDLPSLTISQTAPAVSSSVVGIGYGLNRAAEPSAWDANWNLVSPPGQFRGFYLETTRKKRWGTNQLDDAGLSVSEAWGDTYTLDMTFDEFGGDDFEMQAVLGDSGGGLFYKRGDAWELAGIIIWRSLYKNPNQPEDTAVFTNQSFAADLSRYRPEIMGIVPEPSAVVMLLGLGIGCLACSVRRRANRPGNR